MVLRWRRAWWLVIVLVVLVAAAPYALRLAYPFPYRQVVEQEAQRNHLDPYLVVAVMRVESHFRSDRVSPVGAIGLMQIMPATGRWIASRRKQHNFQVKDLYQPQVNIAMGTWYLAYLVKHSRGRPAVAVAAYNAGLDQVTRWVQQGKWDGRFHTVAAIPYNETREFVSRVNNTRKLYTFLYQFNWTQLFHRWF